MSGTWVAIDFETANAYRGSPCAVGLTAVQDGRITDRMYTLIRPPAAHRHFDPYNTLVHGIRAADVESAPGWAEVLQQILEFTAGRTLVAHNAAFDLGVLRDACTAEGSPWPTLRYACSLVVARKTWRLISYTLPEVARHVDAPLNEHHQAGADADAAAHIMLAAMQHHEATTLDQLLKGLGIVHGSVAPNEWSGSHSKGKYTGKPSEPLPGANPDADPNGALYGKTVCITGTLSRMKRAEAQAALANVGGTPVPKVSGKTDILVVATPDPRRFAIGSDKSDKQKTAERLLESGRDIEIIGEADFFERLNS
ncbi:exonuclease domain-containing protein [Streptomyces sp. NPDC001978]|uniref:exonuclease domain-containing protein n=1 Tax=Streptomyces sp. NPDC001978 TaxID=3364627 RepID=UPI003679F5F1